MHRFGTLLSCWVHERKHRMVKAYAQDLRSNTNREYSILSDVTCQHLTDMDAPQKFNMDAKIMPPSRIVNAALAAQIRNGCADLPAHGDIVTSRRARVSCHEICHIRDVAIVRTADRRYGVAEIWCFLRAMASNEPWLLIGLSSRQSACRVQCGLRSQMSMPGLCRLPIFALRSLTGG